MHRRHFLNVGSQALLISTLAPSEFILDSLGSAPLRVVILHTNDLHSRIDPIGMDGSQYQGMGGAERRAELIKHIRNQTEHVLVLDSGDILQGTAYFNRFKGELEFRLMDEMGYDASTLGNHDFDAGIDQLARLAKRARFAMLNCNYDVSETPLLGVTQRFVVVQKGEIKIGITGVGIDPEGLIPPTSVGRLRYGDPVYYADQVARHLREGEKCHLVICLSHLGYRYGDDRVSDVVLAEKSSHIDMILGGHTHTFLPRPDIRINAAGRRVVINQVGWAGVVLGKLDLLFEKRSKQIQITSDNQFVRASG